MRNSGRPRVSGPTAVSLVLLAASAAVAAGATPRWFPDRPVAWRENDDRHLPVPPRRNHLQELDRALLVRDSLANEVDRALAIEGALPALDVNALDEVPCSTWFCARNHQQRMSTTAVVAGAVLAPPVAPLRIVKGKDRGATTGFEVLDAHGRRFLLKLDPVGHLGMVTTAEVVGNQLFHAAGYNVPGATLVDLAREELTVDPAATYKLRGVEQRRLTKAVVDETLRGAARSADGRLRAAVVSWVPGDILGGIDMLGRRPGDHNDRLPHQHRRSLRASWVMFAWLAVLDPSSLNTLDGYVEEDGRRFVRHYVIDLGGGLGAGASSPHRHGEHLVEVGRTLGALGSLGLYQRPFQDQARREEFERMVAEYPAVGYYPAETFDPDTFRTNRKHPAHVRMTDRDAYWGAKLVTSFTDAQIAAVVDAARLPRRDAAHLLHALRVRRDILGRRFLAAMTAVENPRVEGETSSSVCFDDLAIARGYLRPGDVHYEVTISDGYGRHLDRSRQAAVGAQHCTTVRPPDFDPARPGSGYRIVEFATRVGAGPAPTAGGSRSNKAARIHLRWRPSESRFVVVGLERDE